MKVRNLKVPLPSGKYFSQINVNHDGIYAELKEKKRIALLFISLNSLYWPYLKTVIEDAKKHFLPHHYVDFFVWSDIPMEDDDKYQGFLKSLPTTQDIKSLVEFAKDTDELSQLAKLVSRETITETVNFIRSQKDLTLTFTEPIEWPMGTLMRYHLFLQKEKELKDYDYIFYLDVDMRIVDKISDEILGGGLTAAQHPMYALKSNLIPPYEPNSNSTAYIPRSGIIMQTEGKQRFVPLYVAGGFQGGTSKAFIKAMKTMKRNIDKDFNKNYMAIWNDESHWNKYVFQHANPADGKPIIVLSPSYIYPDSLIKEYYEPIWGCSYPPKIITLTKAWQTSKEAGEAIRKQLGDNQNYGVQLLANKFQCPTCKDIFQQPKTNIRGVLACNGSGKPHELDVQPI